MNKTARTFNPLLLAVARRNLNVNITRHIVDKVDDVPTHTGQKWSSDDYRLVRFSNSPKQVNPNWAVNLIAEVPPKEVTERVVWCDGGSGPEGHPKVYINLEGHSQRSVVIRVGVSRRAIRNLWERYQDTGSVARRAGTGRIRATTDQEDRYILLTARWPMIQNASNPAQFDKGTSCSVVKICSQTLKLDHGQLEDSTVYRRV
ncbi:hypothetical protein evm_013791 [Chilo suppressalis]|nr:hypothetical protein evm_013791 [Chilo suppressalis]